MTPEVLCSGAISYIRVSPLSVVFPDIAESVFSCFSISCIFRLTFWDVAGFAEHGYRVYFNCYQFGCYIYLFHCLILLYVVIHYLSLFNHNFLNAAVCHLDDVQTLAQ